ncbi:MAG: M1 family metallopeptidase [Bacteroidia bacterium]|nr:M1 family metallopeptidase [Bacteroidia bacterium]
MKKVLLFSLLIFQSFMFLLQGQVRTRSYVADAELESRNHNVNFTHLKLNVAFEPAKKLVKGDVVLAFTPLSQNTDSIWLDGIKMTVLQLTLNGKDAKYRTDSAGITIYTGGALQWESKDSLEIQYQCTPARGLYFIGWNDTTGVCRRQIWSQGEGTDNRYWIPMYDNWNNKLLTETIITFDKNYEVLSNGTRLNVKENKDGTKTWHYKMEHPQAPYLIMIGIGKYEVDERKTKSGLPVHLWYYPDWKNRVVPTYRYATEMIDFYEKEIGVKFGWESYSQIPVQDFLYGAMENTTATVYGDFLMVDDRSYLDRNYIGVDAHELAHQWFGDLVTCRTSASMWLHESFATYYSSLFDLDMFGQDYFDWERRGFENAAITENKKNTYPIGSSLGGTTRIYPQGAFVLNMLKYVAGGREIYNKAIKYYLEKHKYQNVESNDLLKAFEETTGMGLHWFWNEWIYRSGEPDYNVSISRLGSNPEHGPVEISVTQQQELTELTGLPASADDTRPSGLFKMPVVFEIHYKDGSVDKKQVWIEKQNEKVLFENNGGKEVDFVLFDPGNQIMKTVTFHKTFAMLKAQALRAGNVLDRYDAVAAMQPLALADKRAALIEIYNKETFHAVKDEIVAQLIDDTAPDSRKIIHNAIHDKDVNVRKSTLANVKTIPADLLPDYETLVNDSSYNVVATVLDLLYASNPQGMPKYLQALKGVSGTVGRNVEVKWLELSAATATGQDKGQFIQKLVDYTGNSYEFITRINAMNALKRLDYFDMPLLANLVNAAENENGRLAGPATEHIEMWYGQDARKGVIASYLKARINDPAMPRALKLMAE